MPITNQTPKETMRLRLQQGFRCINALPETTVAQYGLVPKPALIN